MGEISSSTHGTSSGQPAAGPDERPSEQPASAEGAPADPAPDDGGTGQRDQSTADGPAPDHPDDEPDAEPDDQPDAEPAPAAEEAVDPTPEPPAAEHPAGEQPPAERSETPPADAPAAGADQPGDARAAAAAQAAADLAEVKRWAAERAAAEQAAAEAAARATAAQEAADEAELERARAEQAATDLAAVREWAAQQAAAERAAAEQATAERDAAERAEAERLAADQAAAAERAAADRVAAERAAAEHAEAERAAAAAAMAAEREAIEQEAAQRAAADREAGERADVERAQARWAAARQAAQQSAAHPSAVQQDGVRPAPRPPVPAAAPAGATPTRSDRRAAERSGGGRTAKVLLAAVLALVLVAGGVLLTLRVAGGNDPRTVAEQVPDAVLPQLSDPSPVLAELSADAPVPTPAGVTAALTPLLAAPALGAGLSAQVVDVATGQVLFDRDAEDPSTPASTAKLLTGLAALTTLDPTDTLETKVVAGSAPGEVVLVGGGDPTLSTTSPSTDYPGAATVADLAGQVQQALAGQQVTRVVVDGSLFTGPLTAPGWGPDDAPSSYAAPVTATAVDGARVAPGGSQRTGTPGTQAGQALATALGAPGAAVALGPAPAGARTLGTVRSAPVERLVEQALSASDNLLAESLARQVALARGLPASFDGAAEGVTAALAEAGVDTTGLTLSDGSGLSQLDRVPARLLVDVVRGAADGDIDGAGGLLSGLPVAGWEGTLAERAVDGGDAAPGTVRAKTGTLLGVNDLAGTVLTADGRLLAFAVLADGSTGSLSTTETALDVVADALAGCGCR